MIGLEMLALVAMTAAPSEPARPVSLELAGVILLLAMFGAVVLARKQIEIGEDDVREAAGMQRLGFEDERPGGGEA